jgi:hypothetical protein
MISLMLLCHDAQRDSASAGQFRERVARSLASLVEGCVTGLIADAALVGPDEVDLEDIADEAGCHVFADASPEEALRRALAQARRADALLLKAGFAIDRAFLEEARDVASFGGLKRARALKSAPDGMITRLAPGMARPVGVLARRDAILAASSADVEALARRLKTADLTSRARRTV